MKYYDYTPARKGDKFIFINRPLSKYVIESIDKHERIASVRNTQTGEVSELKSFGDSILITRDVLIARDPITGEVHYLDQPEDIMLDKGASARIEELEAALKESNEILSNAEKMLSGIYREIELHGEWEKGVSECIDELRATISNNQKS